MRREAMRFVAMAAGMVLLAGSQWGQAAAIININEVGINVVTTGSGSINTTELSFQGGVGTGAHIDASFAFILVGNDSSTFVTKYEGVAGPGSFGSGGSSPSSGSGDDLGVNGNGGFLIVPNGYVSGAALSGTDTYSGQTFSSMGLTPGTYLYTWGSGADADSLTVQIGPAVTSVPLPSSLAGGSALLAMAGILAWRRRAQV